MGIRYAVAIAVLTWAARDAAADDASFGLLDRMRFAPFHIGATDEVGSYDHGRTSSLTLHVQASTDCECQFSFYGTLPVSLQIDTDPIVARSLVQDGQHTVLGTADVGVFGGGRRGNVTTIFRVGGLLPTGTRDDHAWLPSARVGDRVLELPRSAGVRASVSRDYASDRERFRIEAGLDVAEVLPTNTVHVIPRAGLGVLVSESDSLSYSLDTALSADPFVEHGALVRWSAGITGQWTRHRGVIQPAVTIAMTRAEEGWGASLLVDLTASSAALGND
jgi:hypothetical protein